MLVAPGASLLEILMSIVRERSPLATGRNGQTARITEQCGQRIHQQETEKFRIVQRRGRSRPVRAEIPNCARHRNVRRVLEISTDPARKNARDYLCVTPPRGHG